MDIYMTNREEAELLKKWWKDYGRAVLIAVVVGLLIGYGWRFWQSHQQTEALAASALYQQILVGEQQAQPVTALQSLRDQLVHQASRSPYASLAQLLLAKKEWEGKAESQAESDYRWILDHGANVSFKQVARLRLAQLLGENTQGVSQALELLAVVEDPAYLPLIQAERGELYQANGQTTEARVAYQAAIQDLNQLGVDSALLKLRLSSLGA